MGSPRHRPPTIDAPPADPGAGDALLVALATQGDARAFALLYRRYVDRVYDYAARRLGSRGAAEEATQEVFSRAWQGLGRCRDGAAFAGWLFAIARHVVADGHRAGRHPSVPLADAPDLADPDPTPEELAVRGEGHDRLQAARARCLTDKERELFDLLLADLTDREIATALGRRDGAIRTEHWRLIAKLRACLGVVATEGRHVVR